MMLDPSAGNIGATVCEACGGEHETLDCPNGIARAKLALDLVGTTEARATLAVALEWMDEESERVTRGIDPLIGAVSDLHRRARGAAILGEKDGAYEVSPVTDPTTFTREFLARYYTDEDDVRTLRKSPDEPTLRQWDFANHLYAPISDERFISDAEFFLRDATYRTDEGPVPIRARMHTLRDVLAAARALTLNNGFDPLTRVSAVNGAIPFRDGWLDVESGRFHDQRSPAQFVTWRIPFDYEPGEWRPEQTPAWVEFLQSIRFTKKSGGEAGAQSERLLRQIMALPFYAGRIAKMPLLIGPSRAGKGTILDLLHKMVGGDVGAVGTDLDALGGEFGLEPLLGKRVVTIGDARFGPSMSGRTKTRLLSISGGDLLPVNIKNQKPISAKIDARVFIATNETPKFIESSDAFANRFVVLRFTESYLRRENNDLIERLHAELPGIVKWVLGGLRDLQNTGRLAETESGREFVEDMAEAGSQVRPFVTECCVIEPGAKVAAGEFYAVYKWWAEREGEFRLSQKKLGVDLLDAFREQGVRRARDAQARGYIGVRLRAEVADKGWRA